MNFMIQDVYYEYHDTRSSHHRLTDHLLVKFEDTAVLACDCRSNIVRFHTSYQRLTLLMQISYTTLQLMVSSSFIRTRFFSTASTKALNSLELRGHHNFLLATCKHASERQATWLHYRCSIIISSVLLARVISNRLVQTGSHYTCVSFF